MDGVFTSEAVTVAFPTVRNVMLKVLTPEESVALPGKVALQSEEVMPARSVTVFTTFQLASTALTVTLKAVPAVWGVGAPVLPVEEPGAAVSPGASSSSLTKAPALSVIEELVLAVFVPSVISVAVIVRLPAVFRVTVKLPVPVTRAALDGNAAFASEEVIPTVWVTLVIKFQLASTALTVMAKAVPAVSVVGVPVLPVELPGTAVSPGAKICNLVKAPAPTAIAGLVLPEIPALLTSAEVRVQLPTVLSVTLSDFVPLTRGVFAGNVALASLEVMETVSLVFTTFQFASTAFTVTLKAVPAVWAEGVPVLPVVVPGAAISPGARSCNLTKAPELMVMAGLVLEVFEPSVLSLAVSVAVPPVLKVTLKDLVPATKEALAGRRAFPSEDVRPAISVTVLTRFQLASTDLTVTLNGEPAVWALGMPVLPLALPGEAVSPGTNNCSLAKAPELTVMEGVVLAAIAE